MNTMQDKTPYNENNEPHGYWEVHWSNGNLHFKEYNINGEEYGYAELYFDITGKKLVKTYYAR